MQELSKRISAVKPSPTVALNGKAKAMARDGISVINLTVGEPDFPTPQAIVDIGVQALQAGKTKYGPAGGGPELKAAIRNKLERDNQLKFEDDEIVVGIGAKEILFHLALATLNEGDEVLIPAPYWVSYTAHCDAAGAKAVVIPPVDPRHPVITPEILEKYATTRTKAIILNSPNNPGGFVMDESATRALGQYLTAKPWWIVSDEIYEYLTFEGVHQNVIRHFPKLRDRYIHINGMSKGFAMTGWRVGYACGPKDVIRLVKILQTQSSTCLPPFIEAAATFALNEGPHLMQSAMQILEKRRTLVVREADKVPGIGYVPPQGAFYLFLDLRDRLQSKSSMDFATFLLEQYHVAMVPGEAFGVPGFVRMSYAAADEQLVEGLQKLSSALDAFA